MPSSWEQIPKELLEAIFDQIEVGEFSVTHTRKTCLFQLMLTCKHWSSIAKEAFYNEQFTLDLRTAKQLISDKTTRQLLLKDIVVTYELASDAVLINLLSMCPDVSSLRARGRPINVDLPNIQKSFYTSLIVLSQSNHLAKLRRAEFDPQRAMTEQVLAHQQQAILYLKHSLTYLQIVDSTMNVHVHNYTKPPPRFVKWFDYLQDFPRLNTVKINVGTLTYLYEMDPFIQNMRPTVTNITIVMTNNRVLQPLKRIDPATIAHRSSTTTLELEMDTIRAEDLNYIMHKFDSLSELQITVLGYESNVASSLNEFRSDHSLKRFFEYLTGLSKFLVTNILVHNSLLHQALMDLKKCFQIKHLTLSNIVPTFEGISISIKSLSKARNGHRGQALLDLEIGTAQLLSVARLVYEISNEDVVELQFGDGLVELQFGGGLVDHYDYYDEYSPCQVQGEALKLGINLLPLLKTLTAINPDIDSMKSVLNPKAPKLTLDLLNIGSLTRFDVLSQMSQRIQRIERWVAPYFPAHDENMVCQNYVLNMPFTTFGEIEIHSRCVSRFIVKLSTSSNTTFHGVGLSSDNKLPTKDDYYQEDDKFPPEYDYEENPDAIGKVTIVCPDVKRLRVGATLIYIED